MPKFLVERRTERGERNRAGCACNALKRFGEGSGPEPGPLRSLNQRIHDTAHSTGGSGKKHPGEAQHDHSTSCIAQLAIPGNPGTRDTYGYP